MQKNKIATILSDYGPEYDILLKFKIKSIGNEPTNIFHITRRTDDDRFPALFLIPSANGIGFRSNGVESINRNNVNLDKTFTIHMRQRWSGEELKFKAFVNGEEFHSDTVESGNGVGMKSTTFLMLSDPFFEPADVEIEYFYLDKKFGKYLIILLGVTP